MKLSNQTTFKLENQRYLQLYWSDKGLKGKVGNLASVKMMLTVHLKGVFAKNERGIGWYRIEFDSIATNFTFICRV